MIIDIAVAGWNVVVELVTSHAHKRGIEERLDIEGRRVLGIVVRVLALEVATGVNSLEDGFAVCVFTISGAAELPLVTIGDYTSAAGNRVMAVEDEWLEDLHILDDESTILEDSLSVSAT